MALHSGSEKAQWPLFLVRHRDAHLLVGPLSGTPHVRQPYLGVRNEILAFVCPCLCLPAVHRRFANYIGGFPAKNRARLVDLLFNKTDPSGLGLNIVRYNIGGGFNAKYSPQFVTTSPLKWRGMPGFRPDPSKPYVWNADDRQRSILTGAKARGANILIAYANSPPWWMLASSKPRVPPSLPPPLPPRTRTRLLILAQFCDCLAERPHVKRDLG